VDDAELGELFASGVAYDAHPDLERS
jgi:hypothetical protein